MQAVCTNSLEASGYTISDLHELSSMSAVHEPGKEIYVLLPKASGHRTRCSVGNEKGFSTCLLHIWMLNLLRTVNAKTVINLGIVDRPVKQLLTKSLQETYIFHNALYLPTEKKLKRSNHISDEVCSISNILYFQDWAKRFNRIHLVSRRAFLDWDKVAKIHHLRTAKLVTSSYLIFKCNV